MINVCVNDALLGEIATSRGELVNLKLPLWSRGSALSQFQALFALSFRRVLVLQLSASCWNRVSSCMDFLSDKHNCVQERSRFKFYFQRHAFAPRWLNTALGHGWLVACLMSQVNDPTCTRGVVIKAMTVGGSLLGWGTVCPLWENRFLVTLHFDSSPPAFVSSTLIWQILHKLKAENYFFWLMYLGPRLVLKKKV